MLPSSEAVMEMANLQDTLRTLNNAPTAQQERGIFRAFIGLSPDNRDELKAAVGNQIERKVNAYESAFVTRMFDRRLYRSSRGFLGLGPRSTQEGDQIWLVRSAHVPFVLRQKPNDDAFTLIGETYLHGFMHGEM